MSRTALVKFTARAGNDRPRPIDRSARDVVGDLAAEVVAGVAATVLFAPAETPGAWLSGCSEAPSAKSSCRPRSGPQPCRRSRSGSAAPPLSGRVPRDDVVPVLLKLGVEERVTWDPIRAEDRDAGLGLGPVGAVGLRVVDCDDVDRRCCRSQRPAACGRQWSSFGPSSHCSGSRRPPRSADTGSPGGRSSCRRRGSTASLGFSGDVDGVVVGDQTQISSSAVDDDGSCRSPVRTVSSRLSTRMTRHARVVAAKSSPTAEHCFSGADFGSRCGGVHSR